MNLRPYQKNLINNIRDKFKKGSKRVILCAPTGGGKTVMFSTMVYETLNKDLFARVLLITDRKELLKQTAKTLNHTGVKPVLYDAAVKKNTVITSRCVVAMVETLKRRFKKDPEHLRHQIGQYSLIIIDEAHKGNFTGIFDIFPDNFYVGATATPLATSKKNPLKKYWNDISFEVDTPDLIVDSFLCQAVSYHMKTDLSGLKVDGKSKDYTNKSLSEAFSKPEIYEGVTEMFQKHCQGKKTMIFCVNIEESIKIAELLNAYCVHSKINKQERDDQLKRFHADPKGVMVNCGVLTTGYDHPPIEVIILNRATTSLPLFLQMCGRGSRISPNKEHFTIIDMGGNINRLGLWEQERDWIEIFKNPLKAGAGKPAPVKDCPKCGALIAVRITECPYCNYKFPVKEKEYLTGGELEEVNGLPYYLKGRYIADLSPRELLEVAKIKGYKSGFVFRVARSKGLDFLRELEAESGYKKGWHVHNMHGSTEFKNFKLY